MQDSSLTNELRPWLRKIDVKGEVMDTGIEQGTTVQSGKIPLSSPYDLYVQAPSLTSLQICRTDPLQHDEMLFLVMHQTHELWFREILHELDHVLACLKGEKLTEAITILGRITAVWQLLAKQIHLLEKMTPDSFLHFRDRISEASGFQSSQFREIEFVLGLRDQTILEAFQGTRAYDRLLRRFEQPGLPQAFNRVLLEHGFPAPAHIDRQLSPDSKEDDVTYEQRLHVLKQIYENRWFEVLYDLCEALVDLDQALLNWRMQHLAIALRFIGFRPGTGKTGGAQYLRSTLERHCFPALLHIRTELGPRLDR